MESKIQRTEVLRQELRDITSEERKHRRSLEVNKNRAALGEVAECDYYTTEFVTSKAYILKKKSLRIKEYQHLQKSFMQSEDNINAFLKVDNVLQALVRELSGTNPALQLAAANCCCNIALGNVKACTALAKVTTPYLLAVLDSVNVPLMDVCIWTIGNLATGSEKAFEIVHAQGSFKRLLSLMNECDIVLLPSVVYATMHYIHAGYKHLQDFEVIEMTQAAVKRLSHHNDHNMIWLLALLSSGTGCVEYLLPVIPPLIDYLHTAAANELCDVIQVTAVIRLLANVIWEPSGQAADALLNNAKYTNRDVIFLLDKLLSHPHIHIRKETLWLAGNLCNHSVSRIRQSIEDLAPSLVSLKHAGLSITKKVLCQS